MEEQTQVVETNAPVGKEKRKYVKRKEEFYDKTPEQLKELLVATSAEIKALKKENKEKANEPGLNERTQKIDELTYKRQRLYVRLKAIGAPVRGKREKKQPVEQPEQPKVEENSNGAEVTVQQTS